MYNNKWLNKGFNIIYYQKIYIKCLLFYNEIYNGSIYKLNERFKDIKYLLTENIYRQLKSDNNWHINNWNIEEISKGLITENSKTITIDIYTIKTEFKNRENKIKNRNQNIIILSKKRND